MSDPDDPLAWVGKADGDLLCIANNLNNAQVPWDIVAFHAQQAAEKMLKAFLVGQNVAAPRTHDLGSLLGECIASGGSGMETMAEDCDLLTPHATMARYPGDEPEVSEEEALEAVAAAKRIRQAVLDRLRLRGSRDC